MQGLKYEKFPDHDLKPNSLVVLLHGIGADAFDLIPLAKHWSLTLKKTKFYSLHAPYPYKLAPSGRQWFDLEDRDQTRILNEIELVKPIIVSFLNKKLKDYNLKYKDLILVGFSQGTMVALNLTLTIKEEVRGVLGYSGGIILTKSGKIEINSKPNICLIHGKDDEVVPKKMMEATKIVLKDSDMDINTHLIENLGHSINQEGLEIGQNFLVKYLLKC
jgi:phospholipase/carboxylesterase